MSDYFDPSINRISAHARAKASHLNDLRDELGLGFDLLPDANSFGLNMGAYYPESGAANAYAITTGDNLTSYQTGMEVVFIPTNSNTGASTMDVDGLGAKLILLPNGDNVSTGDLSTTAIVALRYNGTAFMFSGAAPASYYETAIASATNAAKSASDAATAETNAGKSATAAANSAAEAAAYERIWTVQTTSFTTTAPALIIADVSSGGFTITFPASPTEGQEISIQQGGSTGFATNNLILNGNGKNIMDDTTFTFDLDNLSLTFVYNGTDWRF